MRRTALPILLLLLLATTGGTQTKTLLPTPSMEKDNLRIINDDGTEFTAADLNTYVHLKAVGMPLISDDTKWGEVKAWAKTLRMLLNLPPEATEDDVDFKQGHSLLHDANASDVTLDIRARVQGDYVITLAVPDVDAGTFQVATHRVRFGEIIPPEPDPVLAVEPSSHFSSEGPVGGPFDPPEQIYVLTNEGRGAMQWAVKASAPWLVAIPSSGVLTEGQTAECHVGFGPEAEKLGSGPHFARIDFDNLTNGKGDAFRLVSLEIEGEPPPPPTEKLLLFLIYEEQDEHSYPMHVSQLIRTEEWEKLRSDPPQKGDKFKEEIWDPDSAPGPIKTWIDNFKAKGWSLPVFVLADQDGNVLKGPEMPESFEAGIKLVKDHLPE